jgi:hypothetical protein
MKHPLSNPPFASSPARPIGWRGDWQPGVCERCVCQIKGTLLKQKERRRKEAERKWKSGGRIVVELEGFESSSVRPAGKRQRSRRKMPSVTPKTSSRRKAPASKASVRLPRWSASSKRSTSLPPPPKSGAQARNNQGAWASPPTDPIYQKPDRETCPAILLCGIKLIVPKANSWP